MTETWLILALAVICFGLAGASHLWRSRGAYARSVATLNQEIVDAAEAAAFGKRVTHCRQHAPAGFSALGDNVNRLFDALNTKDRQMRQREALFQDLANTMPEVVLVHRDRVIFANNVAAGLLGPDAGAADRPSGHRSGPAGLPGHDPQESHRPSGR